MPIWRAAEVGQLQRISSEKASNLPKRDVRFILLK